MELAVAIALPSADKIARGRRIGANGFLVSDS
jgi:hypothetical protein